MCDGYPCRDSVRGFYVEELFNEGRIRFCKKKQKISDPCAGRYPYQAILTIDGITEGGDAKRIERALEGIGGVRAEADVSKRRMIVRMMRAMDDNTIRSAVESLGSYIVNKIERTI